MFGRKSTYDNSNEISISLINDIICPLAIFGVLCSNAVCLTIIGIIIKEEKELSNIYLMLPLISIVTLNVFHLRLNIIRLSIFFLLLGYVLYDFFVLMYCNNIVINAIYLFISSIQMFCALLSYV